MKKIFILITMVIALTRIASAQSAKSVYFELGGPGLASINFDTRFGAKEGGLGGKIGVGGFTVDGTGIVFIPIALNYLLSKDSKNYFEMGIGVTPVLGSDGDGGNFSGTFGHLNFGYRLQPLEGGFTFRAFITPVFGNGFFIPFMAGYRLGISFKQDTRISLF